RLVLSGDDDDFDDTIYRVQPKPEQINILFLGDDSEKDPNQLLYYVKRAFQQTRRQAVNVLARASGVPGTEAEASNVTLVVVPGSLAEVQLARVKSLLSNGCTVLAVVRDASANHNLGELAGGVLQEAEAGVSGYAMLGQIDFQHPLFAPFADPRYSDFTRIHFWKHRRVRFLDPQGGET